MVTEAQKRATSKYRKEKMKQISMRFSQKDYDLYEFIQSHDNVQGYLKSLIRADMEMQRVEAEKTADQVV